MNVMNEVKAISVVFEPDLPHGNIELIRQSISLLRGVYGITDAVVISSVPTLPPVSALAFSGDKTTDKKNTPEG